MLIKVNSGSYIVFDLDDTLYSEIDYLKSAYHSIAENIAPDNVESCYDEMLNIYQSGGDTFAFLIEKHPEKDMTLEKLLYLYRNHYPAISLREGAMEMIHEIIKRNGKLGMVTDGRSITQRNKIKSLGIESYFDKIVISEEFGSQKPEPALFESFMDSSANFQFYYIGDNIIKDFISPKKLKWCCIGVLNNRNLHIKEIDEATVDLLPHFFIRSFKEIEII